MFLVIGSNMTEAHPVASTFLKNAVLKGAKLIVVDPRRHRLVDFADMHLPLKVGSDIALLNAIMHVLIAEDLYDKAFVDASTTGFDQLKETVAAYPPEQVVDICGIDADTIREVARLLASVKPVMVCYTLGITEHTCGKNNVMSTANLQMLLGNMGVEMGGVNPLRGQNNVQGACDMGGLPNVLTGYQPVGDPAVRERFSQAWGRKIPERPGLTITEMVEAMLAGRLKGLFVIGENPKLSDPDWQHFHHALKALDFLVVQDLFLSETAQVADVVLSAASLAEKEGTFTNTERRCMRFSRAIDPLGDSLPDWEILSRLSTAMGYPMNYRDAEQIFDELASLTPRSYAGMSYARLGLDGLQWPCPDGDHPGTAFLYQDAFARGKGRFHAVVYQDPAEMPDADRPYFLTTGRMFAHYHTGTMTRISPHLDVEQRTGYVEINPQDAAPLHIQDGDIVILASRRGEMEAPARVTAAVSPGTLFLPIHFGENPTNVLTSAEAVDPFAKIPEFKVSTVQLRKLKP
jgi:predicted molibdopterin-dependent oxidoreductase YjgC